MFTYQTQPRVLALKGGKLPSFPTHASVHLTLGPTHLFGGESGPLNIVLSGSSAEIHYDGSTGRVSTIPRPGLKQVSLSLAVPPGEFSLKGNVLQFEFDCNSFAELTRTVEFLHLTVPAVLGMFMPNPSSTVSVKAELGDASLNWEMTRAISPVMACSQESYESHILAGLAATQLLWTSTNRRLLAAVGYSHLAARLLDVGDSKWEFMAEVILNLYKTLEILFGRSRTVMRAHLTELGFSRTQVEGEFIPICLLRDQLDVGHARLSRFDRAQMEAICKFLDGAPRVISELLIEIFMRVQDGRYRLRAVRSSGPPTKEKKAMARLVSSIEAATLRRAEIPPEKQGGWLWLSVQATPAGPSS